MNLLKLVVPTILMLASSVSCQAGTEWVVRPDGVGPVRIGMSLTQLNAALHAKFSITDHKDEDEEECFYVSSEQHPDIGFMIEDGRLARVDVYRAGISTLEGIHVGDSEAHAKKVYGPRLKVSPHAYTAPEGHYLTIRFGSGRYGIRFETDDGKIVRFYAGLSKAIAYIEGCA